MRHLCVGALLVVLGALAIPQAAQAAPPKCQTVDAKAYCRYTWPSGPIARYNRRVPANRLIQNLRRQGLDTGLSWTLGKLVIQGRTKGGDGGIYDQAKVAKSDARKNAVISCAVVGAFAGFSYSVFTALVGDWNWKQTMGASMAACLGAAFKAPSESIIRALGNKWKYGRSVR